MLKNIFLFSIIVCAIYALPTKEESISGYKVNKEDVDFRLYTKENVDKYVDLEIGELENLVLNPEKQFKILIHGYNDDGDNKWIKGMKDLYMNKGDYYVLIIDWKKPARGFYNTCAKNTKNVGVYVALFLQDLHNTLKVSYENFHLIGHSLGAHVAGFAGKYIIQNDGNTIGRITGMDPAGPLFRGHGLEERLHAGDAKFVDVIHTDGKAYGIEEISGTVDFYVNGGIAPQPGCWTYISLGPIFACSHTRAKNFFAESINSVQFIAAQCSNYKDYNKGLCKDTPTAIMGENVDLNTKGVYYLNVNSRSPFAKNGEL